jgi:vacuolar-type H+-ATPase subunit F/Vma7
MSPIQVIGDANTVLAFALGGVPGTVAQDSADAVAAIQSLRDAVGMQPTPARSPVVLLVTQQVADSIREHLKALLLETRSVLVIEIPGFGEAPGVNPLRRFVEKVLGVRV